MTLLVKVEYGSTVYGTATPDSDVDYICIHSDECSFEPQILSRECDINNYSHSNFQRLLNNQDISCIEAFHAPEEFIHYGDFSKYTYHVDLKKLRSKFSERSSNSWVKAKKKILVEKDQERIGLKSLFHSIRILDFGIQLALEGKIYNFGSCNDLYWDILEIGPNWNKLEMTYSKIYNEKHSKFKQVAPKL